MLPPLIVLSFTDVNDTALDLVRAAPERVFGFLTRPTLAKSFPTTKSGFDESFSNLAYIKTLNAPSSLYTSKPCPPGGGITTSMSATEVPATPTAANQAIGPPISVPGAPG